MSTKHNFTFTRLSNIPQEELLEHMSNPRIAEHLPLLTFEWDQHKIAEFIAAKEEYWERDRLGHWAILLDNTYIGWGGFQKENQEWDFGLVLKTAYFGLGRHIIKKAIEFAISDQRIPFVTFLLPLSRTRLGALSKLGAKFIGEIEHDGTLFLKYQLETK